MDPLVNTLSNERFVLRRVVDENKEQEEEEEFEDEEEFKEEEPQEEEDGMEVDIEEEENEPELIFPYVEADPLNPLPPASDSEPEDVIEVEDTVEPEDEIIPASVHEVGESSTATFHREDSDSLFPGFMRRDINSLFGRIASLSRQLCGLEMAHALVKKKGKAKDKYYGKLILDLGNEVRSSMEEGVATMENLVRKLGNAEERAECKKLKKELEDARGVVFKERSNEAIDVSVKDEEIPSSKPQDPFVTLSTTIERMITQRVNEGLTADRARRANVSGAGGSGQGGEPAACECTFDGFMKCNPTVFHGIEGAVATMGLETVNQMPWTKMKQLMTVEFCPIEEVQRMEHEMVEPKRVKVNAYIRRLSENIKGEVTSYKPTNLSEVVRMAHKLMEQKVQVKQERAMEGNKRKWENFQSGNSSRGNYKDNSRHQ
ncbi:hypothetical protein Tco_1402835 [Tanacetum coccineum]